MKIIAFKRAGNHPSLHSEYIVEYVDASLIPSTEGYETMVEEHFLLELAKNPQRHEEHLRYIREQEQAARNAEQSVEIKQTKEDKEMQREFAKFKAWQKSQQK